MINKRLLPMKGHYLLLYSGLAPIAPFLPVMAKDLGFSAFVVGTIFTVVPLLSFPAKPLLGGIADKFQCQKLMFMMLLIVQGVFYLGTFWLPPLPLVTSQMTCDMTSLEICSMRLASETNLVEALSNHNGQINCKMQCPDLELTAKGKPFEVILNSNNSTLKDECISLKVLSHSGEIQSGCNRTVGICQTNCDFPLLNQILTESSVPDSEVIKYYQFWLLLILLATAKIASAVLTSIGDAICFNLLGDKPNHFGLQRLWGAVGWGTMSVISGLIVDKLSEGSDKKFYSPAYYFLVFFAIADILVSSRLNYNINSGPPKNIMKDLYKVVKNKHIVVFMLWCTLNGFYTAMVWNFLFWFLEEVAANNGYGDMTYIKTLEGLTLTFHCYLGEIPFFFISSWLIKKIGHINSMTLVLGAFALRFIIYSYLTNPWWTLPVEMLNGITFGIFYATMTTYACTFAPPGTETTVQNLVAALYDALGISLGSFVGGYMIQTIGGVRTFWILGLSAAFFTVAHIVIQIFMKTPPHYHSDSGSTTPDVIEKKEFRLPLEQDLK